MKKMKVRVKLHLKILKKGKKLNIILTLEKKKRKKKMKKVNQELKK
jgi:hypothetical protein